VFENRERRKIPWLDLTSSYLIYVQIWCSQMVRYFFRAILYPTLESDSLSVSTPSIVENSLFISTCTFASIICIFALCNFDCYLFQNYMRLHTYALLIIKQKDVLLNLLLLYIILNYFVWNFRPLRLHYSYYTVRIFTFTKATIMCLHV